MRKVLAGLILVAAILSAAWLGHAVMTGIAVPYPDPTPEQAASEMHHLQVSNSLLIVAAGAWLAASISLVLFFVRSLWRTGQ